MVDEDKLAALLIDAALNRRPLTYGQVLHYFERRVTPITVRALCRDLGRVCARLEADGAPDLAVLVVRRSDGLPGDGYFLSEAAAEPLTDAARRRLVEERQACAFGWARERHRPARRTRAAG